MAKKKEDKCMVDETEMSKHANHFDENGKNLWEKISRFGKNAGAECIYYVLILYYTLISKEVKPATKALIIGALGYFISPIDLIPDVIIGFGYLDDISALLYVVSKITSDIKSDNIATVKEKAKKKIEELGFNMEGFKPII